MAGYLLEILGLVIIMLMPPNMTMIIFGIIIKGIGGVPHTAGLFARF
jgi:glycoside/pentoside/hexuronide:cation symporter, GPH family